MNDGEMKLEVVQDLENKQQVFTLTIPYHLWVKAKFYPHDHLLFGECDRSSKISDKLLGLETLVRRIEKTK